MLKEWIEYTKHGGQVLGCNKIISRELISGEPL